MAGEQGRAGIQSIERAFAILEAVAAARDGASLSDVARKLELHTSTVFHLVKTMQDLGYVEQDAASKRYRLGGRLLGLVGSSGDMRDNLARIESFVGRLAETTGENAHYAIRSGDEIHVLLRADGKGPFRLTERMGMVRPAHATAIGKVLLAFMPEAELKLFLARTALEAFTPRTITDAQLLTAELARVREAEVAFDDAEFHDELRCAAVPVRDFRGSVTGALGISGPAWHLSLSKLNQQVAQLRKVARQLSQAFGGA